eukprot:295073-Chlamydomonas_euryale.AAC.8
MNERPHSPLPPSLKVCASAVESRGSVADLRCARRIRGGWHGRRRESHRRGRRASACRQHAS